MSKSTKKWSISNSLQYYGIKEWGAGYFTINRKGHLTVQPYGEEGPMIDVMDIVEDIQEKKLGFPCVIRFQDILRSQVELLNKTFNKIIQDYEYKGKYFGVFPIKVNQMCEVVEEIIDAGSPYHYGLEAGSKGELLTVLALNKDPKAITVCNGYKDKDYLRLALMGRQLGRKVIVVIEKLSELPALLELAAQVKVEPMIGLRAKLTTKGAGRWEESGGDFAKFGLTIPEIMHVVEILQKENKQDWLKLFHFHIGSQISDIRLIKESVREGARIFAKLCKLGFNLEYFDVGGGLGIDYDGSRTASDSSRNYSMEEYVGDVVYNLQQVCEEEEVPEPHIVSESGRAIVAPHSCVIIPIFGSIEVGKQVNHENYPATSSKKEEASVVTDMREILSELKKKNLLEVFHDAQAKKEEALSLFKLGFLELEERAIVETLYWKICREIIELQKSLLHAPEDTADLQAKLADQYLANFSVFQSAPDHWAFEQLFPIVPIHRHKEEPQREASIVDITCDSDGKIDQFIDRYEAKPTLLLHDLKSNQPYYIGMFLLGAYQEVMGDMHNLFGRVHEVHVFCDDEDPEDYYIEEIIRGDTSRNVLQQFQYSPAELIKTVKQSIDREVRQGRLKPKEGVKLIDFYEDTMDGYTYLRT
ncbi:MAG: biosynthetic arginine decarboxylase [Deltaproteobacteria bacterium]|nr:biosynthetic arginine decarboxylase [Deltaproteobacteria bacterium]